MREPPVARRTTRISSTPSVCPLVLRFSVRKPCLRDLSSRCLTSLVKCRLDMDTINFTRGVPANESFPTADRRRADAQYGPSRGFEPLRQWLAEWQECRSIAYYSNGSLQ